MTAADTALDTADREIAATRVFDAPRSLVWTVWTDPKHLAEWWGPNGFTTTTKVFDLRPGGEWLFTMHGPDGTDYRNDITFTVIIEPALNTTTAQALFFILRSLLRKKARGKQSSR